MTFFPFLHSPLQATIKRLKIGGWENVVSNHFDIIGSVRRTGNFFVQNWFTEYRRAVHELVEQLVNPALESRELRSF